MKIFSLLLTLSLLVGLNALPAQQPACHDLSAEAGGASPTQAFAALAHDAAFRNEHLLPAPLAGEGGAGQMVEFAAGDGNPGQGYYVPTAENPPHTLIMIHEWWGLNEHIKEEAERMASDLGNIAVLAVDLYDGKVATTREAAGSLMQSADEERIKAILQGAMDFAGEKTKLATIGWCFGGGWSLQAGIMGGKRIDAVVMYYGMPIQEPAALETLTAPVLGIFAKEDKWINSEVVQGFEKAMQAANRKLIVEAYEADHAFANPSNPAFDEKAATEAYQLTVEFLRQNFVR